MGLANTATAGNATIVTNSINANLEMHFNALSKDVKNWPAWSINERSGTYLKIPSSIQLDGRRKGEGLKAGTGSQSPLR